MNQNNLKILEPMKYYWIYFLISLSIIIPGTYSLIRYGLRPSIDFTGGSNIVWQIQDELRSEDLTAAVTSVGAVIKEQSRDGNKLSLTTSPLESDAYQKLRADSRVVAAKITELEYQTVGPSLGGELIRKTLYGVSLSALLIMLYVAYRFKDLRYGISAILAMLHDSLVLLGTFSLLGHYAGVEVDTLFVTAVLTILSFSVHDTIVVYDRIRELKKHYGYLSFVDIINRAVVETMGRSLNNSLTIIFMLLSMYLLGGESIRHFILALLVGTISGTYSSTFTAAPILVFWNKLSTRKNSK
ncbi:MAG: protein translocase subunit SecF [Candidatus Moraniibacteriota bacterium]|nr:MAG: protein translocase subunit SecF [Candidatus Moranbacteria bacterium]